MASEDYKVRHHRGMSDPNTPEEGTLVRLYTELTKLSSRHRDDSVLVKAAEHVGSAIIVLLNGDTGRIDPGLLDAAVRAEVGYAGGDPDEL